MILNYLFISMRAVEINDTKIYELTKDSLIPEFLSLNRQRKLKKREKEISKRLELIHDFSMPDISTNISLSPDENYLFILGAYSPRIRVYELEQMSMKFERHSDELPTKISFIERDYSKFVVLEGEKTLTFHGQGGIYTKIKCDEVLTDILYSNNNGKVYASTSTGNLTMVDLVTGCLYFKFVTSKTGIGFNCLFNNKFNDLLFCGCRNGSVEVYDPRTSEKVHTIDVTKVPSPEDLHSSFIPEITKLTTNSALMIAAGTNKGVVHLYDLRNSARPWHTRDLFYRCPLKSIIFHEEKIIAAVGSVFKIWEPQELEEGVMIASYETNRAINDFFHYPKSGLFISATNDPRLSLFFIPRLGDAPRWCRHLSSFIVDMEVQSQSMFDTHTFVTVEDLDQLNLKHLIGSPSLTAYTHGYYISRNTYNRAKSACEKLTKKTDLEPQPEFLDKVVDKVEIEDPAINACIKSLSVDARFKSLFTNDEFLVDSTNKEFERVILQMKLLEKKHQNKKSKKDKALRAHELANIGDDIND